MHAIDWLAKHSLYHPEKTALVEAATGRRFSYLDLNAAGNRAANLFARSGVRPGDRIAVLCGNCAELLFAFFGSTKIGAIFLPLNFRLAAPELRAVVEQAQPTVLIYSEELAPLAEALQPVLPRTCFMPIERFIDTAQKESPTRGLPIPVDDEAPQMMLFTSGTTGQPKGALLPHRMILWNSINFANRDLLPTDIVLSHSPLFYTGGLNVYTMPAFFLGGTVVLTKGWNTEEALDLIARERVSVFFGVPTQLLMFADSPRFATADLTSLRYIISGGAPCPVPLMQRLMERGLTYKQGMGLTEVGPNCFCLEARDAIRKAGSIGFPNFAMEARIVDEGGRDLAPDEVGELILRSPAMTTGYWNNPEATAAAIRDGWFYTGDLARRDEEGYYYIVDRKKDMYISGGENVYPAEIENLLRQHPKVNEVAVVGIPHEKWGEVGCAAVVLKAGENASAEELMAHCHGNLAKFKIPRSVRFVEALPRTHSGKVQKQELRRLVLET